MKTGVSLLVALLPCASAGGYHGADHVAQHAADHAAEGLPPPSTGGEDGPALDPDDLPIVGQAPWRYKYEPLKLQMPADSNPPYSHGLEVDADANLYLTYYDKGDPTRCLLKWSPADGYEKFTVVGHGSEMCQIGNANTGPHGLRISKEPNGTEVFYMANNNQVSAFCSRPRRCSSAVLSNHASGCRLCSRRLSRARSCGAFTTGPPKTSASRRRTTPPTVPSELHPGTALLGLSTSRGQSICI